MRQALAALVLATSCGPNFSGQYPALFSLSSVCSDASGGEQLFNGRLRLTDRGDTVDVDAQEVFDGCGNLTATQAGNELTVEPGQCSRVNAANNGTLRFEILRGSRLTLEGERLRANFEVFADLRDSAGVQFATCNHTATGVGDRL